jgi:hypothetical protein
MLRADRTYTVGSTHASFIFDTTSWRRCDDEVRRERYTGADTERSGMSSSGARETDGL